MDWNVCYELGKKFSIMNEMHLSAILDRARAFFGDAPKNALDLGCGTGDLAIKLARCGIKTIGLDISAVALKTARHNAEETGLSERVTFLEFDIEHLEKFIPGKKFDIIFSKLIFAFLNNKEAFLQNVLKLLQPRGIFVLITPVLREEAQHSDKKLARISVPQRDAEEMFTHVFGVFKRIHTQYFDEYGIEITYLIFQP